MLRSVLSIATLLQLLSYMAVSGETAWDDLKVTWGQDPFDPNFFVSLPRVEADVAGWKLDKDCSKINGRRYVKDNDRAVMLVFGNDGQIAGIASAIPKNLAFNFPSAAIQPYLVDEGDFWTITAYFKNPATVCSARQSTGDRLVIKGSSAQMDIPLTEIEVNVENQWTKGYCFNTMGLHYWRQVDGKKITLATNKDNFFPMFLLYNKGKLNSFGFAFNMYRESPRYEHPTPGVIRLFMSPTPDFFFDQTQSNGLSTVHIYLDKQPFQNFC